MFENSQLNGKNRKRFGLAMILSTAAQVLVVALLILVPLFITNTPAVVLADKLFAPPPEKKKTPDVEVFTKEKEKPRETETKVDDRFTAPPSIPRDIPGPDIFVPEPPKDNTGVTGGVPGGIPGGGSDRARFPFPSGDTPEAAPLPPPPPPPAPKTPERVRVGGNVQAANLKCKVTPVYPALARQARVQGVVVLEAEISTAGKIEKLKVLTGHPLLVQAALDAVKQWCYEPTLLNGEPVPVVTTITVNFAFSQ